MFFTYMNNSCARFNQTVLNLACCSGSVVQTSLLWISLAVRWIYMPPSGNSPWFFCKKRTLLICTFKDSLVSISM